MARGRPYATPNNKRLIMLTCMYNVSQSSETLVRDCESRPCGYATRKLLPDTVYTYHRRRLIVIDHG